MPFTLTTPTSSRRAPRRPLQKSPAFNAPALQLRLSQEINASARQRIRSATHGLPALSGSPIYVKALPQLTAHRGKLLSATPKRGTPVHAASFIRRREMILESELLTKAALPKIVTHEIFHFVWPRLSNSKRASYAKLVAEELSNGARGELGESSGVRKKLSPGTRDYICESFCDTAAWLYAPAAKSTDVTLAPRWREKRKAWFFATFAKAAKC